MHENRETSETPAGNRCRSAGEGSGHTARVYVCEGSHCGIVPMNHSNKDGTSSAESEEGRLRIKESAGQSNTCPTQSGEAGVSQGLSGVRTSGSLGRYSSEIRTGCANERPSGSVRGAPGDWCPYRDRQRSEFRDVAMAHARARFMLLIASSISCLFLKPIVAQSTPAFWKANLIAF